MEIITERELPLAHGCVLSIGNFDGVHLGHGRLLDVAADTARSAALPSLVWTFAQNPKNLQNHIKYICGSAEKLRLLAQYGCDAVYFADFDDVRRLSPQQFVDNILIRQMRAKTVVCGFDFRFGNDRLGDAPLLEALLAAHGCRCTIVPAVTVDGIIVSSTAIRHLIADGSIPAANRLLGRRYGFTLPITSGLRLGKIIGYPTINQQFPDYQILPRFGVYTCICHLNGTQYRGISNIGVKPTIGYNGAPICETHLFDFHGDINDYQMRVELVEMLRAEIKFSSIDELKSAIASDIKNARFL